MPSIANEIETLTYLKVLLASFYIVINYDNKGYKDEWNGSLCL